MKKTPLFKMKTSIKLILIHLTVLSCVRCDEITVSGYEGGDAVINCPYPKGFESTPKYLQKGGYTGGVELIRSDGRSEWTHSGRVSLQDKKDSNIFTVTIHNLTLEDAGTYICGIDIWGLDFYTHVNLNIAQKSKPQPAVITTATPGVTMVTPANTSGHMAYLTGALIGALGLAGLLVVTFRLRKSRAKRKRAHSPSRHLSSARPVSGNSREETADYENDLQDPNTLQISSAFQSLNPNTTQPDAVYQSLNPNTTQPDAVYQSLNPNTTQPDAV